MEQHLSHYRIFYEVAKAGNISKAAKELYISQPAISKSISKLEDSLDIPLFSRNSRGVSLTDEGKILFEHISTAFSSIILGENKIKKIKELNIGNLRIGSSATLCKNLLIPYLGAFIDLYPYVTINIASQSSLETIDMLEKGILDLGLVAKPKGRHLLNFKHLMHINDIFVASPDYLKRLEIKEGKNYNIFSKAKFMLLNNANSTRQFINEYLYEHSIKLQDAIEVTSMDLLIEFSKIGLGVACVIKEFVTKELESGELIQIDFPSPIPKRSIGFSYMTNNPNPSLNNFLNTKL